MYLPNVMVERKAFLPRPFADPLFESRLSSDPLYKCCIGEPMSNSAPTYAFFISLSFYTRGAEIAESVTDSLRAGRSGNRIPVGARFPATVHTGPGDHPASYTMGTGSFPVVNRLRRGVDHTPHLAPGLKKE
jgi:hypothetical protein